MFTGCGCVTLWLINGGYGGMKSHVDGVLLACGRDGEICKWSFECIKHTCVEREYGFHGRDKNDAVQCMPS